MRGARIAAVVLGFLGGGFGLIIALSAVALGYEAILGNEPGGVVATMLAASGVPVSAIAMMGAYIARERAGFAARVLLVTAFAGFVCLYGISYSLWFIPGLLLLAAAVLAFAVRRTDYVPPKDTVA